MTRSLATILLAATAVVGAANTAEAGTCSSWRATCESRGGSVSGCQSKFDKCMATGTWTEGAQFGGTVHKGVRRK